MNSVLLDCYKTSLNDNPERLRECSNLHSRGINWMVEKIGRQWALAPCFWPFPLFKTKKDAYQAGVNLVLIASRYEAKKMEKQMNEQTTAQLRVAAAEERRAGRFGEAALLYRKAIEVYPLPDDRRIGQLERLDIENLTKAAESCEHTASISLNN